MIGSFNGSKFSRFFGWPLQLSWDMEGSQTLTDDVLKTKCRLCGGMTARKNYFFSDSGKALQLKRIILRVCEIEVSERDELPKFCCRSCHDKVLRLNNNLKIFASTCQSAQKELERELKTSRQENIKKRSRTGNTPQSTEKPRKIPHSMVTSARKRLPFGNQQTSGQEVSIGNTICSASAIHVLQGNQVSQPRPESIYCRF